MTSWGKKSIFYSQVICFISNYALVWHILKLIKQNNFYWQGFWPVLDDLNIAAIKVQLYKNITRNLFKTIFPYVEYLQTDNKEGKKYYKILIKTKLLNLEKQYYAVKKELKITGSDCCYKKEIWDKSPIQDKWRKLKKTCWYYFCFWHLMGKHTNITTYAITNSVIRFNIRYLFDDNVLLNFKDKKKNRNTNKDNDNVLFEEKFIITGINLQPKTLDLPISINFYLNSTLLNSHIMATHSTLHRLMPQKTRFNTNKKPNTSFHIPAINDLDLSFHNSAKSSSICK